MEYMLPACQLSKIFGSGTTVCCSDGGLFKERLPPIESPVHVKECGFYVNGLCLWVRAVRFDEMSVKNAYELAPDLAGSFMCKPKPAKSD